MPARRPRLQFASPAASPCVLTVTAISHTMYRYACLEVMNCKAACPPVAAPTTPASGLARRVPFPPTQAIKQGDACRGMWGGWVGTQPSHAQPTARSRAPPAAASCRCCCGLPCIRLPACSSWGGARSGGRHHAPAGSSSAGARRAARNQPWPTAAAGGWVKGGLFSLPCLAR